MGKSAPLKRPTPTSTPSPATGVKRLFRRLTAPCAFFAAKLTHHPHDMRPADLDILRTHGLDDRAIHDATQVIAYFNYINRVADALGVEPETFIQPWGVSERAT